MANIDMSKLPRVIDGGKWNTGHVQGITVDTAHEYIYFSFTTKLIKTDMQGNVIGTVTGLLGHLGCIDFNDEDGKVYGSLELKHDSIGQGIMKKLGVQIAEEDSFYVAIFDVDKITRVGMDAEKDGVMTSVLLKTVVKDYLAKVKDKNGNVLEHRHGCSGFDGISFGPSFDGSGKNMLTIAYGIYGDTKRTDNDHQVFLQYDTTDWAKYATIHSQNNLHRNGPEKPEGKYFVFTGNTTWGVQNLEYDKSSNLWFLACYTGKKAEFANYSLFCVDGSKKAKTKPLQGVDYQKKGALLSLAECGAKDPNNKVYGWHNEYGACGICSLGGGYFYLTEPTKNKLGRGAILHLAHYIGADKKALEYVE